MYGYSSTNAAKPKRRRCAAALRSLLLLLLLVDPVCTCQGVCRSKTVSECHSKCEWYGKCDEGAVGVEACCVKCDEVAVGV